MGVIRFIEANSGVPGLTIVAEPQLLGKIEKIVDHEMERRNRMQQSGRQLGAVEKARRIFESMPTANRKAVIDTCAEAGVKRSTASTQYQLWKSKHK